MTLLKRILSEKRDVVVPFVISAFLIIAAYSLVVYPLGVKSTGAADRASAAARDLQAAERDQAVARALVNAKSRAEQALTTFYLKVLPADLPAARRTRVGWAERYNRYALRDRRCELASKTARSIGSTSIRVSG